MQTLEKHTRKIGDHEYEVTLLNAIKGRKVFARFAKIMIPALAEVAKADGAKPSVAQAAKKREQGAKDEDVIASLDPAVLSRFATALERVADKLTEEDFEFFCEAFASSSCVIEYGDDGKRRAPALKDVFALHFAGKYHEMVGWLVFCFEVNFGSFFGKTDRAPE